MAAQGHIIMTPKEKFVLFRRTKHFCSAPWNLLFVDTDGSVKTCNKGRTLGHNNTASLLDLLNNQEFQSVRKNILQGTIPSNCKTCIALEDIHDGPNSYKHIRGMYNDMFQDQVVDYHDIKGFRLGAVDLHWSSICDLKCVTCWAKQSSSIAREQNQSVQHTDSQTAAKIIKFIVDNQDQLQEVYFSGGEPSLIKYNLSLLQQLKKRTDLHIRVNSNLMWSQDNAIIQEILKFPQVMFTCSADNIEQKFEYIRRGASWSTFVKNLAWLYQQPNVQLRINLVFFVLSALDLSTTIDYFYQTHHITDFSINQCGMGHTYFQTRNLDAHIKLLAINQIQQMQTKYADLLNLQGGLANCLTEISKASEDNYQVHLDSIDRIAGSNWRHTFPELL